MIVLFWSRATRDLLRSFGWGIAALHRLHAATKLPRPRRPPHSVYRSLAGWVAATRLCAIPRPPGYRATAAHHNIARPAILLARMSPQQCAGRSVSSNRQDAHARRIRPARRTAGADSRLAGAL